MVKELLTARPFLKAQSTQLSPRSLKVAGQSGPDVLPTEEPQGQSPLKGVTVRTVHYFHSTAQPQDSHWSGANSGVGSAVDQSQR